MNKYENLQINNFQEEGLYLIFSDEKCISITQKEIKKYFKNFFTNKSFFPLAVRNAAEMELCEHCPGKKIGEVFCVALRPVLPFLEDIDKYMSYEKVTAVYRAADQNILTIAKTDLQSALTYVSIISLIFYCKNNEKYKEYFYGIRKCNNIN